MTLQLQRAHSDWSQPIIIISFTSAGIGQMPTLKQINDVEARGPALINKL